MMKGNLENGIRYVFSGLSFESDKPELKLDILDASKPSRQRADIIGKELTFSRYRTRICTGHYDLESFESHPCPDKRNLQSGSGQCYSCRQRSGFNPAFYNVSPDQLSSKQRSYNQEPHDVYLVHFGGQGVKVGICNHHRTNTRWLEQGARSSTIIFRCSNAYEAREREKRLVDELGFSETVSRKQKMEYLSLPYNRDDAVRVLTEGKLKVSEAFRFNVLDESIVHHDDYYFPNGGLSTNHVDISDESPLYVSGKVVGAVGDVLVFENGLQQFVVNTKKFLSHVVRFTDEIRTYRTKAGQLGLF